MPKVFISYSHDPDYPPHRDRILALSNRLRAAGVDCIIDQYEQSPSEGWPQWCARQIKHADFVLVACTETYLRRYEAEEKPNVGRGATWEGNIITQDLYDLQGRNTKFIPILFDNRDSENIPDPLRKVTNYRLLASYDQLYRRLTDQPDVIMPALGSVKAMPAREPLPALPALERKPAFQTIWHVPYSRNPFFTGREKTLHDIETTLDKRKSVALGAIGGTGKTETAIEFAYRHADRYQAALWTNAESRDTLLADFVSIAAALHLPSAVAKEQAAAVAEVKRWFASNAGWLLIFDNADEPALTKEFLPPFPQGHLLFTTKARALGGLAERLPLEDMSREEGALLLLRRACLLKSDEPLSAASPDDQSKATEISRELGGLPLALDQAGAFIEESSSLAEYLSLYRKQRDKLLAERGSLGAHPSVMVTFSSAFEKVAEKSPAAADLIRLCAFLAPEAIPEEIFTLAAAELGPNLSVAAKDELNFANAIKEATRFSLLDRDAPSKTLDIHRLVQATVQANLSTEEKKTWAGRVVRTVSAAFPYVDFKNWDFCQRLLPHAQACAGLIDAWEFEFAEAADLLNQAGFYLDQRALYAEAEPLYRRSVAIREKALGPDHPDVAQSLNNLASLYRHQGKYSEAEPLNQRALAIREKALGPDHPNVATSLNNLAGLYAKQGKYAEAEALCQRALAIREKSLGPDHPDVATSLNNLAALLDNQGKYAEAEPLYHGALAIREKALGPDHPDVAQSLNNLALLFDSQGKYAEAEPLYQRSLAIREKALGPDHPDVATSLNNLATLFYNQGKYAEAEPLYQRSLAIQEKALGPGHPNVATSLNNLAFLYDNQGKYAEAEPLYQRSLAICEKTLGSDHPNTRTTRANLEQNQRAQSAT